MAGKKTLMLVLLATIFLVDHTEQGKILEFCPGQSENITIQAPGVPAKSVYQLEFNTTDANVSFIDYIHTNNYTFIYMGLINGLCRYITRCPNHHIFNFQLSTVALNDGQWHSFSTTTNATHDTFVTDGNRIVVPYFTCLNVTTINRRRNDGVNYNEIARGLARNITSRRGCVRNLHSLQSNEHLSSANGTRKK